MTSDVAAVDERREMLDNAEGPATVRWPGLRAECGCVPAVQLITR